MRSDLWDLHFGLYIDKISNYIAKLGGSGACAMGSQLILLYANDVLLISDSPGGL